MDTNQINQKDTMLWNTAHKRAKFKSSLVSYLLVNAILIGIWAMGNKEGFWPKYVILFWGVGLLIKFFKVYLINRFISPDKEYNKLKNDENELINKW